MRQRDLAALVANPGLTPDAVRVVLHYVFKGPGPHPYDADELAELLEEGGPKRVARALRRAERRGYLVRKLGGKGHTDSFDWNLTPASSDDLSQDTPADADDLSDRSSVLDDLNDDTPADSEGLNSPVGGTLGGGQSSTAREDVVVDVAAVAREAVKAMNRGMAANPLAVAEGYRPVLAGHGGSVQQAADWLREGIPPVLVPELVEACARGSSAGRVSSLRYFAAQVSTAYAARVADQEARAGTGGPTPRAPPARNGGRRVVDEQVYTSTGFEGFKR